MNTVFADEFGFNSADATSALQDAIDDPNADRIVVRDTGNPWLISEQIELQSNKEIVFEEGAVVQAKPGSFLANDKAMFVGRDIQNIKLTGQGSGEDKATLKMNKEEYTSNQFGHVVSLLGVSDYEVSGLKLTGGGGDGLHIAAGSFKQPDPNFLDYSENGVVENIEADNNRRSGLSIDSAKDLVVRNSTFTNSGGTSPSSGITLEPTWNFEALQNVRVENVDVRGNEGNGLQMTLGNLDDSSRPVSVDFDGVTLEDSKRNAIFVNDTFVTEGRQSGGDFKGTANKSSPTQHINGEVNFNNIDISNADAISSGNGANNPKTYIFVENISGDQGDSNNLQVNFDGVDISDPQDTTVRTTPIFIQGLSGDYPKEIGNTSFNNVNIQGNYSTDVVRADLGRGDSNLNNISGNITVDNANQKGADTFLANEDAAKNLNLNVTEGDGTPVVVGDSSVAEEEPPVELETVEEEALIKEDVVEPETVEEEALIEEDVVESEAAEEEALIKEDAVEPETVEEEALIEEDVVESEAAEEEALITEDVVEPETVEEEALIEEDVVELETVEEEALIEEDSTQVDDGTELTVEDVDALVDEDLTRFNGESEAVEEVVESESTPVESAVTPEDSTQVEEIDEAVEEIAESESTPVGSAVTPEDSTQVEEIDEAVEEIAESESTPVESAVTPEDFTQVEEIDEVVEEVVESESTPVESAVDDGGILTLDNSGFNDGLTGWTTTGGNVSVVERSQDNPWVSIDDAGSTIYQDISSQTTGGENYQLNVTGQVSESGTTGYVGVGFVSENNELIDLQAVEITGGSAESAQLNFTAPEEFATAGVFALGSDDRGALFVDDFSLAQQG